MWKENQSCVDVKRYDFDMSVALLGLISRSAILSGPKAEVREPIVVARSEFTLFLVVERMLPMGDDSSGEARTVLDLVHSQKAAAAVLQGS